MAININEPGSPGWWLNRAWEKLEDRTERLKGLDAYRKGDPPVPDRIQAKSEFYKSVMKLARLNVADTIVCSVSERLRPQTPTTADAKTSKLLEEIYEANELDITFPDAIDTALAMADAYLFVSVAPVANPRLKDIQITIEDPREAVTFHNPARQSEVRAAAKFYHDAEAGEFGMDVAMLVLPGKVYRAYNPVRRDYGDKTVQFSTAWQWDEVDASGEPIPALLPANMADIVPVVRLRNRRGQSEFEPHIDVLDRINHTVLQRVIIETMQAFKQRALQSDGAVETHYPDNYPDESLRGKKIDWDKLLSADPESLWFLPEGLKIWESTQANTAGIMQAVEDDLKHLAAVTRRPIHIFAPENESATASDHANAGLIFITKDRSIRFGRSLAKVLELALMVVGAEAKVKIQWDPFEWLGILSKATAAAQAKNAGMSLEWIMVNIWQATPDEVRDEVSRQAAAELMAAATAKPAEAPSSDGATN